MGMMNHSQINSNAPKKLIHEPAIKVANQIKRDEIINDGIVTTHASIRVDNHTRNRLTALLNIGLGTSQKEIIDVLVNEKVDSLAGDDKKRFNDMYSILEKKDYLKSQK